MNTREFVSYYKKLRKEQDETIEDKEAREEIEEIFNLIAEVIAMDEEVKFKNKGTFSLLKRKKRRIETVDSSDNKTSIWKSYPQNLFRLKNLEATKNNFRHFLYWKGINRVL